MEIITILSKIPIQEVKITKLWIAPSGSTFKLFHFEFQYKHQKISINKEYNNILKVFDLSWVWFYDEPDMNCQIYDIYKYMNKL